MPLVMARQKIAFCTAISWRNEDQRCSGLSRSELWMRAIFISSWMTRAFRFFMRCRSCFTQKNELKVESSKLICVELSGDYQLNLSLHNKIFYSFSFRGTWTRMECRLFPVASTDYDFFFSSLIAGMKVQNSAWSEEIRRKRKKHHHILLLWCHLDRSVWRYAVHREELEVEN